MAMWPAVALTVAWLLERLRIQPLIAASALLFAVSLAAANVDAKHRRGLCFRSPG